MRTSIVLEVEMSESKIKAVQVTLPFRALLYPGEVAHIFWPTYALSVVE